MTTFNKENTPNAGKLMASLRHSGYDNNIAISDLVDNSLDAGASEISISISDGLKSGKGVIAIADNGDGMDAETLSQALRLGSLTEREPESDLGRFGIGMVTASISMAKQVRVYTRVRGGELLTGILDIDIMTEQNSFSVHLEPATSAEKDTAATYGLNDHGTVVVLSKCDKIINTDLGEFERSLTHHLGETYRYFLRSGKQMTVNGRLVKIIDPMWQDGTKVEEYGGIRSEERVERKISFKTDDGKTESFIAKVFILPEELTSSDMKKEGIGLSSQGFYVLRNYRQIAQGENFGDWCWKRHNSLNRVRVELLMTGAFDGAMGVNYTKHSIKPTRAMLDKIKNDVMPDIDMLRKKYPRKKTRKTLGEIDYTGAESLIKRAQKLLDWAAPEAVEMKVRKPRAGGEAKTVEVSAHTRTLSGGMSAAFSSADLGVNGPILKAAKKGKVTDVVWNDAHPFFERFVLKHIDEDGFSDEVSLIGFALAEAGLKQSEDVGKDAADGFMGSLSKNLGTLFS